MIQADDYRKQTLNARIHIKKTHCINKELPFVSHAITVQNSNKLGVKNVNKWFEGLIKTRRLSPSETECDTSLFQTRFYEESVYC